MIFIVKKLFHNFVLIEWLIGNEKLESIGLLIVYKMFLWWAFVEI